MHHNPDTHTKKFYIDGLGPKPHVSIGSQALVNAAVEIIENRYPGSEYYFLSACPPVESQYLSETDCRCHIVQRPGDMLQTFLQVRHLTGRVDAVVCPWGDAYISSPPYLALRKMLALHRRRVPRMLMTSSLGPFDPGWKRFLAVQALRQFDVLTVRDSITYESFHSLGLHNVRLYPDTAFVLQPAQNERIERLLKAESVPVLPAGSYVGVNISVLLYHRMKQLGADYLQLMAEMISQLISLTDRPVLLIPHQIYSKAMLNHYPEYKDRLLGPGGDDRRLFPLLCERLSDPRSVYALHGEYSARDYKGVISRCTLFVGGRMHAVIAALSCCVPSLILEYSHKAHGLMDMLSLGEYRWSIQDTPSSLRARISLLHQNQKSYRSRLSAMVPSLIENAYAVMDELDPVLRK